MIDEDDVKQRIDKICNNIDNGSRFAQQNKHNVLYVMKQTLTMLAGSHGIGKSDELTLYKLANYVNDKIDAKT